MTDLSATLGELAAGRSMSEDRARWVFEAVLSGSVSEADLAAMLTAIAGRGATVDELVGAARAMRDHAVVVARPETGPFAGAVLMDTCGTGGAPKLFNVSTLGAIVAVAASAMADAGRRVMICKHGNTSRTGRGSAELMRELGVRIDAPAPVQTRCLGEVGLCFSLAPAHHPAARHAAGVRKSLEFPTIFNLLGPLVNPAGAERQLMGTWTHGNARLLALALAKLGTERSLVFCSRDGLDELTVTDTNLVYEVAGGGVRALEVNAAAVPLPRRTIGELQAETLDDAVRIARGVLGGEAGACREITLLNAGAVLWLAEAAPDLAAGVERAARAIDSGAAARTLSGLVEVSNS